MPFEPGHSIPGGRKPGSTNEKVNKVREAITAITEGGIESFNECMDVYVPTITACTACLILG